MEYNLIPSLFPNIMKMKIVAKKILKQQAYARGSNAIQSSYGNERTSWIFPLPEEYQDQISHDWQPYESIASRLASKIGDINTAIADFQGLKGAASSAFDSVNSANSSNMSLGSAIGAAKAAAGAAQQTEVPAFKVDSSLVYKDTNRVEYNFSLNLVDIDGDPYNSIFLPIQELKKLSCPEMNADDLIGINFPYIFEIYSIGSDLIRVNNAAITSISPVWKPPYINNYPTHCELNIILKDIEPLYRQSFDKGGIIRTNDEQNKDLYASNNQKFTNGRNGR